MNSLEIQYFLTIVKYGSFTEAAQTLSVSQPAISKQIRQLEAELGCSLFARSGLCKCLLKNSPLFSIIPVGEYLPAVRLNV